MKILVLGGGNSPERDVSLRSADSVREALIELGHKVGFADPAHDKEALVGAIRDYELVFPILHGAGGEDGTIQQVLETCGKPYLGSGVAASQLCFDKAAYKQLLEKAGLPTPAGAVVNEAGMRAAELAGRPFVLKPVTGGSSLDTFIERETPVGAAVFKGAFKRHGRMLLEELVEGTEITVPVLGKVALPVIEIVPPQGEEFDYENKYNGATAEWCPPRTVSIELQQQAQRLAEKIHRLAGCRHLSRTDMMISRDGRLYVLETNTMPGLTDQSLFPKAAKVAGLSWKKLVARFVELAAG